MHTRHFSKAAWVWIGLCFSFCLLYGFTLRHDFSYDGLCYALDVELAPVLNLFHPNHLLYSAVSHQILSFFRMFGYQGRAIFFMQSLNALVGALAVATLGYLISRRVHWVAGLLAGGIFGLSFCFWSEATDPGCYAWAGLAACLLLILLLESDKSGAFWVGAGHGVLVLFHQMLILVAPAMLLRLWLKKKKSWAVLFQYLAGLFLTVGIPYGMVAVIFHGPSWRQMAFWALGPGGPPPGVAILSSYWWDTNLISGLESAWSGWVHSLISSGSITSAPFLIGSFVMAVFLGGWIAWAVKRRHEFRKEEFWPLIVWVLVLNAFMFFFYPGTLRYRILFWPPLLYLGGMALGRVSRATVLAVGLILLISLGFWNGQQGMKPLLQTAPEAARAAWVRDTVHAPDFLVFAGQGPQSIRNVYRAYFAPRSPAQSLYGYWYSHPGGDLTRLQRYVELVTRRGGRLWVEKDLLDPSFQKKFEEEQKAPAGILNRWLSAYRWQGEQISPKGYRLVVLRPQERSRRP